MDAITENQKLESALVAWPPEPTVLTAAIKTALDESYDRELRRIACEQESIGTLDLVTEIQSASPARSRRADDPFARVRIGDEVCLMLVSDAFLN